jgi:hypothetical protein
MTNTFDSVLLEELMEFKSMGYQNVSDNSIHTFQYQMMMMICFLV